MANSKPASTFNEAVSPGLACVGIAYLAPLYEYVALADRKASFSLSAGGLMLTVLGFFLGRIVRILSEGGWLAPPLAVVLVTVVVLVVVAGATAYVAFARLLPPTPPTLAVFRDIAARTVEQYGVDVHALSHRQAMTDMLCYNHVVSTLAAGKFRLVNRAVALLRIAIPLWMLVLLVLAIAG